MTSKSFDCVGISYAPVDVIVKVDEEFLESQGLIKNASNVIDAERELQLRAGLKEYILEPGGATANTLSGVSALGGRCGFISRLGTEHESIVFRDQLERDGISFFGKPDVTGPSDKIYIFTTADLERTFGSFHGVGKDMNSDDIDIRAIEAASHLIIGGFLLNLPNGLQILQSATSHAKKLGTRIVFTPNDFRVIRDHLIDIREITDSSDILLMNEEEALTLTGASTVENACTIVSKTSICGAVTLGSKGAFFYNNDIGESFFLPATPLPGPLVNTNGAGDQFAAGFLFGLTHDFSFKRCARLALACGAHVLTHPGARPKFGSTFAEGIM